MANRLKGHGALMAGALVLVVAAVPRLGADEGDRYSEWSAPENIGAPVNTAGIEFGSFVSRDGLSLYFGADRAGGLGGIDIWVARRSAPDQPWGEPQNVGGAINSVFNDQAPTVALDGHWMYFFSQRPDGLGGLDLYVSRRHNRRDEAGWRPSENLGGGVNTAAA